MKTLRAGIIGVGGCGKKVLQQLVKNENIQLAVIADQNRELAEELGRFHGCSAYDDYRRAIVEEKLDVLFLMLPTFLCAECLQLAAKNRIHVFKEAPLARSLPEAAEWIKLMDKEGLVFQVGAPDRFSPGFLHAHQLLQQQQIGDVFLIRAERCFRFDRPFDWRGDPVSAGGGALIEAGYPLIDQILWSMPLPEKIYCLRTAFCKKLALPAYKTEDTASILMKFPTAAAANVLCSWMTAPRRHQIAFHGDQGTIHAAPDAFAHYDLDGNLLQNERYDHVDDDWLISQQIRQFVACILDDQIDPVSIAAEHVPNVAVIEAAYLSARTSLPEQLKTYGNSIPLEQTR